MRGFCYLTVVAFCCGMLSDAQGQVQDPALGVYVGSLQRNTALGIVYLQGVTREWDISVTVMGTSMGKSSLEVDQKSLLMETDLAVRRNLIGAAHLFCPYVSAGVGFYTYDGKGGGVLPVGIGMQANLSVRTFLLMNAQYRLSGLEGGANAYLLNIGLAGVIGMRKVIRVRPTPVIPVRLVAPRDSDGDGIVDSLDACPLLAGVLKYKGCPPPDRDHDGVNDEDDRCPDTPGLVSLHGCPLIRDSLQILVDAAARRCFFETGSSKLLAASFSSLDVVVGLLKRYPAMQLVIEGHTDDQGNAVDNKKLSDERARSVMEYLVCRGVEPGRLQSRGFGAERPIADNSSSEGRAINRRVEMRLVR